MAFGKILIANRGEIAVRIIRTAHDLGYGTVAVASEADRDAPHVEMADEAVVIGPPEVARSYLDIEAVIAAARRTGAGAVHPGYGFLAENADFAEAAAAAGLVFIGPSAEAIRLMGNKRLAKLRMEEAGVPCVPGYSGGAQDDDALGAAAAAIGYPLMVKAAAGGGGRGMRLVEAAAELADALAGARSEAENAFAPRHVEIQVFADGDGNTVHLGERDCSIQRRHQKIVEEAPSPAVNDKLRAAMGKAAVEAAQAIGYLGAGTVEFLLDAEGQFYFLEMNTRLQVEHPVTELVTGQDLVAWQLRIAAGEPLPLVQDEIALTGHAIEARLYAEDPAADFLPQTGPVLRWRPAVAPGLRIDAGIAEGGEVQAFYDPMLAKVIAHGRTREEARRRLRRGLAETAILGVQTNKRFLIDVLGHPAFAEGAATTAFIPEHFPPSALADDGPSTDLLALAAALVYERSAVGEDWRSTTPAEAELHLRHGDAKSVVHVRPTGGRGYDVGLAGKGQVASVRILASGDGHCRFEAGGLAARAGYAVDGEMLYLDLDGHQLSLAEEPSYAEARREAMGDGQLLAPMAGRIVAVRAASGAQVAKGDILVVLEAMKMEHEIRAGIDGTVAEVRVSEGDQVMPRQLLAAVEPAAEAEDE
jgi:geranyl-CoA carboxylase alpha subunit